MFVTGFNFLSHPTKVNPNVDLAKRISKGPWGYSLTPYLSALAELRKLPDARKEEFYNSGEVQKILLTAIIRRRKRLLNSDVFRALASDERIPALSEIDQKTLLDANADLLVELLLGRRFKDKPGVAIFLKYFNSRASQLVLASLINDDRFSKDPQLLAMVLSHFPRPIDADAQGQLRSGADNGVFSESLEYKQFPDDLRVAFNLPQSDLMSADSLYTERTAAAVQSIDGADAYSDITLSSVFDEESIGDSEFSGPENGVMSPGVMGTNTSESWTTPFVGVAGAAVVAFAVGGYLVWRA